MKSNTQPKRLRIMAILVLFTMLLNLTGCGPINEWRSNGKYEDGLELEQAGSLDEAVAAYTEAITLNPLNAKAFFQRGQIAYNNADWAAAAADLAEAARLEAAADPAEAEEGWAPNPSAPHLAGLAFIKLDQPDNALPQFDRAIQLNAQDAEAFYYRAVIYLAKKDTQKAVSDLDQAISLDLEDDEAHRLANAYYQRALIRIDQADKAIADLSEALKIDKTIVDAYYQRGILYIQKDEMDKAIADLSEVIKLDDSLVDAYFKRGQLYMKQVKLDEALADLDHVIEEQPDNNEAIFDRGMVYNLQGNASLAYTEIDKAIRAGYETADAYYQRGLLLIGMKRETDAIADFTKAIELDEKYADAYFQRGKLYYADEGYTNAILDFDRVVFLDAAYPGIYAERGVAHLDNGDFESALPDLDQAIEANTNLTDTAHTSSLYFLRGYTHHQLGNLDLSLADYQKTVELDSKNSAAYYNMALIYIHQEDLEKALEQIKLAVKNKGGAVASHTHGDILAVLGRYEEAGNAYSASLSSGLPELGLDRALYAALDGDIKNALSYARTYVTQNPSGEWADEAKAWIAAFELELKGEAGLDVEPILTGLDEFLPETYTRDASFEASLNRSFRAAKYKEDPYMKFFSEAFSFSNNKNGNNVSVMIIRLSDSAAQKEFELEEITLPPLWQAISGDKTIELINLEVGDASYAYKQKVSGLPIYWTSFRNGPYGIFVTYIEYKVDEQIKYAELVNMVSDQIDKIVIDFCPFKPTLEWLKTFTPLRGNKP